MFCLEIEKQDDEVIPLVFNQYSNGTCNCRIYTHVACWIHYTTHKGHVECPICHTVVVQQPIGYTPPIVTVLTPIEPSQEIHIIHNNQVYQYRIAPEPRVHPVCKHPKRNACLLSTFLIAIIVFYYLRS
jgi:hypothetical protein